MNKWMDRFLTKNSTDITDKSQMGGDLSVLSVPHPGLSEKNLKNIPSPKTDITDRSQNGGHLSVLSAPSLDNSILLDDFEERLAIVEHDGHQNSTQAQKIAYQDAFITVLTSLPLESAGSKDFPREWLQSRIKIAQSGLATQDPILFYQHAHTG